MNPHTARQRAVVKLLQSIGEDPGREGLRNTPERVDRMYDELFDGYGKEPEEVLGTTFDADRHDELVIVRNIDFYSHCEHHMVPFFGKAHIGYVPDGTVVGLSKLVRLVEMYAHRLQLQERLTTQVADAITHCLHPKGCMVVLEAEHMCMKMRGVKNPCADTVTSAVRGVFVNNPSAKSEFLSLVGK